MIVVTNGGEFSPVAVADKSLDSADVSFVSAKSEVEATLIGQLAL